MVAGLQGWQGLSYGGGIVAVPSLHPSNFSLEHPPTQEGAIQGEPTSPESQKSLSTSTMALFPPLGFQEFPQENRNM